MKSNKENILFEKTSFLQGGNSTFIKELYLKYLKNPKTVPLSWVEFFDGLNEDQEIIKREILGPSWKPKESNNTLLEQSSLNKKGIPNNIISEDSKNYEKEKEQSVKAIIT